MNSILDAAEAGAASTHTAAATLFRQLFDTTAGFIRRLMLAQARRRTMRILDGLDDASLKDIGLSRSLVGSIDRHDRYTPHFARF